MPRLNWINYNTILFQALPMVDNIIQGKKKKEVNLPLSGSILSSKRAARASVLVHVCATAVVVLSGSNFQLKAGCTSALVHVCASGGGGVCAV